MRSAVNADGSVAVGSDVEVELFATLGLAAARDVRVEVVAGRARRRRRASPCAPSSRRVPAGAAGAEQRFVAVGAGVGERPPGLRRPRRAAAARRRRTEPAFLIAWEPS